MKPKTQSFHIDFDDGQLNKILESFHPRFVKKNTNLLREGSICKELYFILNGCIRAYFVDERGFEKTSSVTLDNNFITAWTSFISQNPSVENIEALEDSNLLVISYAGLHDLEKSDVKWREFYIRLIEIAFLRQSRKIEALMTLNTKQRYLRLLDGHPKLIQNVSNKILASFLHMREETLSRLKSK